MGDALGAVPVGIAAERQQRHQVAPAAQRAARQAAGHDLGKRREIRRDAEVRLRAARRVAKAGDDLVEDQHHAVPLGQRAQFLEVPEDRRRHPRLAAVGLAGLF